MSTPKTIRTHHYLYTVLLGVIFATLLSQIWNLEPRWFVVVIVGIILLSVSLIFSNRFSDFITISFLLAVPLSGFEKWLFLDLIPADQVGSVLYSGAIGIGVLEFILAGMYLSWFYRMYIECTEPPFTFIKMDYWILALLGAYILSIWDSPSPMIGFFSVAYLFKHILIYFFLSRNLKKHHIKWLLFALFFAIVFESALGIVQNRTEYLHGLARDKGALDSERQSQYQVPGIEDQYRAEGTTYDSHALGLYLAMMLPIPFLFAASKKNKFSLRSISMFVFLLGLIGLITSFSRSAWLSFLFTFILLLFIIHFRWREKHVIPFMLILSVPLIMLSPWITGYIYIRFSSAPIEIMTTRFEQYSIALDVWLDNFIFGFGVGNYLEALKIYNYNWALELPVHNVFLWNAAETGLLGVFIFYTIIIKTLSNLWRLSKSGNTYNERIALAFFIALLSYVIDGLTNPLFREPVVFMMFWLIISVTVFLGREQDVTK